jgi:predicted nucleic acid-binding protein
MSSPRSWADVDPIVADTSVWINIIASGRAADILRSFVQPLIISRIALDELERGREKGQTTAGEIHALIDVGLVAVAELPLDAEEIYLSLVAGSISETLDDGEAATLALALVMNATAIIDERKAIRLAAIRFPGLQIKSTVELLVTMVARAILSVDELGDVIHAALRSARMRVPDHLLAAVCECIGADRAADCVSLPARVRRVPEKQTEAN